MNCKKCNKEIPSDSKFCPYCGENCAEDNSANLNERKLKKIRTKVATKSWSLKTLLWILIIGVWILVLQNLGIIPVTQNVRVKNEVDVRGTVDVYGEVDANIVSVRY